MQHRDDILKEIAEKQTLRHKNEMDTFFREHILNSEDPTVLILKCHLYLEHCVDRLLSIYLPKPDKILQKTFSNKIDFFEALNLGCPPDNSTTVSWLRNINKIRNELAHDLNRKLNEGDIKVLGKGVVMPEDATFNRKLKLCIKYFVSYFHGHLSMNEHIPFLATYFRNNDVFKKDVCWNEKLMMFGKFDNVDKVIEFGKMK